MDGNKLAKYDIKSKKWVKSVDDNAPATYLYDEIMWIDEKTLYVLRSCDSAKGQNQLYSFSDNKWNVWKF